MTSARFPLLGTRALNGTERSLPGDVPAARTLLLVAFQREHQDLVDRWISWATGAGLVPDAPAAEPSSTAVLEVPVLSRRYRPARVFIDGGMAASIRVPHVLARTWTAYTDVGAFQRAAGIPDSSTVHAFVVTPAGQVLAHVSGEPTERARAEIAAALSPSTD